MRNFELRKLNMSDFIAGFIVLFSIFIYTNFATASYLDYDRWQNNDFDYIEHSNELDQWYDILLPAQATTTISYGTGKSLLLKSTSTLSQVGQLINGYDISNPDNYHYLPSVHQFKLYIDDLDTTPLEGSEPLNILYSYCDTDDNCSNAIAFSIKYVSGDAYFRMGASSTSYELLEIVEEDKWYNITIERNSSYGYMNVRIDNNVYSDQLQKPKPEDEDIRRIQISGVKSDQEENIYLDNLIYSDITLDPYIGIEYPEDSTFYKDFPNYLIHTISGTSSTSTYEIDLYLYDYNSLQLIENRTVSTYYSPLLVVNPVIKINSLVDSDYYLEAYLIENDVIIATATPSYFRINSQIGFDYYTQYYASSTSINSYQCDQYNVVGRAICQLFIPSDTLLNVFLDIPNILAETPPFKYYYEIPTLFDVDNYTKTNYFLPGNTSFDTIFASIKAMFIILINVIFVFSIIRRLIKFKW